MIDYRKINRSFDIPLITNSSQLTKGQTAATYILQTKSSEKYILKSLQSKEQALFEYNLIIYIRKTASNLVSEILLSNKAEPFITLNQTTFQVQKYIPSTDLQIPLAKVLKSCQYLEAGLDEFTYKSVPAQRFALDKLWL